MLPGTELRQAEERNGGASVSHPRGSSHFIFRGVLRFWYYPKIIGARPVVILLSLKRLPNSHSVTRLYKTLLTSRLFIFHNLYLFEDIDTLNHLNNFRPPPPTTPPQFRNELPSNFLGAGR